jgi:hypothetical protein
MKFLQSTNANDEPVLAVLANGYEIYNLRASECGRFAVAPSYYGYTDADADALAAANLAAGYEASV